MNRDLISIAEAEPKAEAKAPDILMVSGASAFTAVQRVISEIAPTDIPVLILGEHGTGKKAIASEIHRLSPWCKGAFVTFNCSNLSSDWPRGTALQGSHNGASARLCGTVLLDDVGQLDLEKQAHLLDLLCDSEKGLSPNCLTSRLISTSTKDLTPELRGGRFREELYFRLNGICLRIPSLRQRKEDIPLLFNAFIKKYAALLGRRQLPIKNSTMDLLLQHSWPGNIRELENIARQIVVVGDDELANRDLVVKADRAAPERAFPLGDAYASGRSLKEAVRDASQTVERQLILESLERTHWNRKRTSRELQISYKALLYKLKQLGLEDSGNPPSESGQERSVTSKPANGSH